MVNIITVFGVNEDLLWTKSTGFEFRCEGFAACKGEGCSGDVVMGVIR